MPRVSVARPGLQPPLSMPPPPTANITMFRPSTFFILVQTGLGLQLEVQLVPLMQVVLRLDPAHRGQMCGEARRLRGQRGGLQVRDGQSVAGDGVREGGRAHRAPES